MPELPEVENIAAGLRNEIIGRTIEKITVPTPLIIRGPYRRRWRKTLEQLHGAEVSHILRRGKRLVLVPEDHSALLIQLGMTGKFLLHPPPDDRKKHIHFTIHFKKDKTLYFVDVRRFGRLWIIENPDSVDLDTVMGQAGLSRMGPEPWDISPGQFRELLHNQRMIKTFLLDQTRLAGLGNIYADESLFATGIHPARKCSALTGEEGDKLRKSIRSILNRAIRSGGTTFSDFQNPYGEMGHFRRMLKVYQRTGEPCKKCRTPIQRLVLNGRSSHFCPTCQPQP